MSDRAYRGGNHPPYCTCVECTTRKVRRRRMPGARFASRRIGCLGGGLLALTAAVLVVVLAATLGPL